MIPFKKPHPTTGDSKCHTERVDINCTYINSIPRYSMDGIFTYIWSISLVKYGFHVDKYTIHRLYEIHSYEEDAIFCKGGA